MNEIIPFIACGKMTGMDTKHHIGKLTSFICFSDSSLLVKKMNTKGQKLN